MPVNKQKNLKEITPNKEISFSFYTDADILFHQPTVKYAFIDFDVSLIYLFISLEPRKVTRNVTSVCVFT